MTRVVPVLLCLLLVAVLGLQLWNNLYFSSLRRELAHVKQEKYFEMSRIAVLRADQARRLDPALLSWQSSVYFPSLGIVPPSRIVLPRVRSLPRIEDDTLILPILEREAQQ